MSFRVTPDYAVPREIPVSASPQSAQGTTRGAAKLILQRLNLGGKQVYISPVGGHGPMLLDQKLSPDNLMARPCV